MEGQRIVRWFLLVVGLLAVALGVIGIVVPLLPTTPFLLLAAACFMRSSGRLYQRLIHNRRLGRYIQNYREHRAMTRQTKAYALTLLWGVIGYSACRAAQAWWLRFLLGAAATGATVPSAPLEDASPQRPGGRACGGRRDRTAAPGSGLRLPGACQSSSPWRGGPPMTAKL